MKRARNRNVGIVAIGLGMIVLALIAAGPQVHIDSMELLGLVILVIGVPLLLNQFSATNGGDHPTTPDPWDNHWD